MQVGFGNGTTDEGALVSKTHYELVWLTGAQSNVLSSAYAEVSIGCNLITD